jgi:hypothetical protein
VLLLRFRFRRSIPEAGAGGLLPCAGEAGGRLVEGGEQARRARAAGRRRLAADSRRATAQRRTMGAAQWWLLYWRVGGIDSNCALLVLPFSRRPARPQGYMLLFSEL